MSCDVGYMVDYLLGFKGPNGKCAKMKMLAIEAGDIQPPPRKSGMAGGSRASGTSDPTQSDAMAVLKRSEKVNEELSVLGSEIGRVGSVIRQCPIGFVLDDYYLTPDPDVTWEGLAEEYGVVRRTVMRWRDNAVKWLAEKWDPRW